MASYPLLPVKQHADLRGRGKGWSAARGIDARRKSDLAMWAGIRMRCCRSIEAVFDSAVTLWTGFLKPAAMNRTLIEQQALIQGCMETIDQTDWTVPQHVAENCARERLVLDGHESMRYAR